MGGRVFFLHIITSLWMDLMNNSSPHVSLVELEVVMLGYWRDKFTERVGRQRGWKTSDNNLRKNQRLKRMF